MKQRIARLISDIFNPLYVAVPASLAVCLKVSPGVAAGFGWWALYIAFSTVIPLIDLTVRIKLGKVSDFHISDKSERKGPLLANICYISLVVLLMVVLGTPKTVTAMAVASLVLVLMSLVITLWWKISLHALGIFEIYTLLVLVFRSWTFVLYNFYLVPILFAVCWSRLVLRKHTPAQLAAGALAGVAVPVVTFLAFGLL